MQDRPIQQPGRQFAKLASARRQIHDLLDRYPSRNADWQALNDAAAAMDRAAAHFGLGEQWWWSVGATGGRVPPNLQAVDLGCPWAKTGLRE